MATAPAGPPPDIRSLLQRHHEQALWRLEQWIAREEELAGALLQQVAAAPPQTESDDLPESDGLPPPMPAPAVRPVTSVRDPGGAEAEEQVDEKDPDGAGGSHEWWTAAETSKCADAISQASPALLRVGTRSGTSLGKMRSVSVKTSEFDMDEIFMWARDQADSLADEVMSTAPKYALARSRSHLEISGGVCGHIVTSSAFEVASAVAVLLNTLLIGAEVEITAREGFNKIPTPLLVADYVFTVVFAVELIMRIATYGRRILCSRQLSWILFDSFLVVSSCVDAIVGLFVEVADTTFLSTARIIRILRITRTLRILRFVRLIRFVRALRIMIYSIVNTLKSLMWAMVLLFMVIYFFAVIFTNAMSVHRYSRTEPAQDELDPSSGSVGLQYWGSLGASMLTLLESSIGGVDWQDPLEAIAGIHWIWLVTFIVFILFTYFAILNVVTAAFCQGAVEGQQYDREQTVKDLISNKKSDLYKATDLFSNMFSKIDLDGSGEITWEEFKSHLADESMEALLALLELNNSDLWVLFRMLDSNDSKSVDVREFVSGCMRLRGPARSIDLAKIAFDQKLILKRMYDMMRLIKGEVLQIRSSSEGMVLRGKGLKA